MDGYEERFWSKVKRGAGCWQWTAAKNGTGYGAFKLNGKRVSAHRLAYELVHGPIPNGMLVCHTCDKRDCVNPDHLFLGTYADNYNDAREKGRIHQNPLRGEDIGTSRLREAQVVEIRQGLAEGLSRRVLAAKYNVGHITIRRIASGENWGWLTHGSVV